MVVAWSVRPREENSRRGAISMLTSDCQGLPADWACHSKVARTVSLLTNIACTPDQLRTLVFGEERAVAQTGTRRDYSANQQM